MQSFRKKLEGFSEEEGGDWIPWVLDLVRIMEGDKTTVKRYCEAYPEGWKEAICVWGVWVDVGLRRNTVECVFHPHLRSSLVNQFLLSIVMHLPLSWLICR